MTETKQEPTKAMIFFHGFTGSPLTWNPFVEKMNLPAFCPALLGHEPQIGLPTPLPTYFEQEMDRMHQWIVQNVSPHFYGKLHGVGYSLGARVLLGLTICYPTLFEKLTLIGVHPGLESPIERELRFQQEQTWIQMLEKQGISEFVKAWETQPLFHSQNQLAWEQQKEQRLQRLAHHPIHLAVALKVLGLSHMPNYVPKLSNIPILVDLLVGDKDEKFVLVAQKMLPLLQKGRFFQAPNCGHNIPLEQPEFLLSLLRFG